uniref:C2H2-type domain-containing protein n=1 Tax=Megaselia scalaris TaxID=36166 RepID=T1H339_MEGSC
MSPHSSSSSNGYNPNIYMQHHQHLQHAQQQQQPGSSSSSNGVQNSPSNNSSAGSSSAASNRRDHNIDYSSLFVQLSGTLPTLYRCVSCNKIVSNRWHHANIHRPQSHECPVCGQKFTRRDNMKAH